MTYPVTKAIRARRRADAERRNAFWQSHTTADQLRLLDLRPGRCLRQRIKLGALQTLSETEVRDFKR